MSPGDENQILIIFFWGISPQNRLNRLSMHVFRFPGPNTTDLRHEAKLVI